MTTLVASWQSLTAAQRDAWTAYAESTPGVDSLGQVLVLTGQQAYVRANTARIAAGIARQDAAPTEFNRGNPVTSLNSLDPINASTDFGIDGGASVAGNLLLYIGRPVSAARNFYKGPYRLAGVTPVLAGAVSQTTTEPTTDPYGSPYVTGERRPVRAVMSYGDGRESIAFEVIGTVD